MTDGFAGGGKKKEEGQAGRRKNSGITPFAHA